MDPPLALRDGSHDLIRLRQRREQRLGLGDLGHFRRRRKPFERGSEGCISVGGAGARLIKPGQRESRAQFEAACPLLRRDRDGGQ
jgi:hypothetical protein